MKVKGLKSMVVLLAGATLMSSCVGSFALFNKLAKWNKHATKSKLPTVWARPVTSRATTG